MVLLPSLNYHIHNSRISLLKSNMWKYGVKAANLSVLGSLDNVEKNNGRLSMKFIS